MVYKGRENSVRHPSFDPPQGRLVLSPARAGTPDRLWRRLGSIAFEDIGLADIDMVGMTVAALAVTRDREVNYRITRKIERVVDALVEGAPAARVTQKLRELERRRLDLEAELSTATAPAPRLHPNLAEVYRRKVEDLQQALAADDAGPARELVRGLIEAIVLVQEAGRLRVEVRGELAAILRLSGRGSAKAPAGGPELLAERVKMVAGDRDHRQSRLLRLAPVVLILTI